MIERFGGYAGVPTEMVTTPEYRALADVERRILAHMLDATDPVCLSALQVNTWSSETTG